MRLNVPAPGILAVNGGSSSLKCRLYAQAADGPRPLCTLRVERIGTQPRWQADIDGETAAPPAVDLGVLPPAQRHAAALEATLAWLAAQAELPRIAIVGHRVVHGGARFAAPVRIDAGTRAALGELVALAPLHQPPGLALIDACSAAAPGVPQFACFDTMFHHGQARLEREYALPPEFAAAGVRRYGFHGLAHASVAAALARLDPAAAAGRVIVAHLGAGASLCALQGGASVATTMGFSTLDGLPMATRCGSIDPGVLIHLQRERGMDAAAIEDLLYRRSGLLGVSGISGDVRELRAAADPRAGFALAQFAWRIRREIGSLAAALEGLDALVFSGGIGENDAALRADVIAGCGWLGARLDAAANVRPAGRISAPGSAVSVYVVAADEEAEIARLAGAFLPAP